MARPPGSEPMDEARLRVALVAAGRRLGARGLISAREGNLSIRLPGERILVTPSGRRKDELAVDDLFVVDQTASGASERFEGQTASGHRPTSDLAIHRAVLAARPDATSVAHAHLPATMALTLAGEAPDPQALPETAVFLPRLSVLPFGEPGSDELAKRVATALTEPPKPYPGGLILERHGAIAVGGATAATSGGNPDATERAIAGLGQAVDRLELIEVLSRAWRDMILLRGARAGGYPSAR
ncbi:MAG TPA: class II aldolase/adducin family protein [Candidatus Limnocylindrales bacterium]|nr:class II aldolase/adducin family protein [Candidatus Limnocylindrales bacterium]